MPDIDWKQLRDKATQVAAGAYAPYSRFPVGAAALVDDGRVVTGAMWKMSHTGLPCARNAVWCAPCMPRVGVGWSRWHVSTAAEHR